MAREDRYNDTGWLIFGTSASALFTLAIWGILRQTEFNASDLTEVLAAQHDLAQETYARTSKDLYDNLFAIEKAAEQKVLNGMEFRGDNLSSWLRVGIPTTAATGVATVAFRQWVRNN